MWAVRRASIQLRNQGLATRSGRICCVKTEIASCCLETCNAGVIESPARIFDGLLSRTRSYITSCSFRKSHKQVRAFSLQASTTSNGEDDNDLEGGFSELETTQYTVREATSGDETDDVNETAVGDANAPTTRTYSAISKAILAAPESPVSMILDKWVEEGNEITQTEVSLAIHHLRRRRSHGKALQLSEWLQSTNHFEFDDKNYAEHLHLIAKVRGLHKAEIYLEEIPESFRTETVYRALLASYVSATNIVKAEELFKKMKDLGFPITCYSCNQMLLLYKRTFKKKIANVLLLMEKEDIKLSLLTYQILIDVKGQANDIAGVEQIVDTMKANGLEFNTHIQASLARYYAAAGLKDKAEAMLREMEGVDIRKYHYIYQLLIPIYASLGREDEVDRIWKVCESDPLVNDCIAVIEAWGHLNKIENAEEAFDKMLKIGKQPSSKLFTSLLKVYTNHKMLEKGKDLVKRMVESGCVLGPGTWDALVKLCVATGEVEKAVTILETASKQKRGRPLFCSYITVMDEYAERGDVHNAEKVFLLMKQVGYASRITHYKLLLKAYVNAKTPAYGFTDRMRADNIFPNRAMATQLSRIYAFKKSPLDDLLE